MSFVCSLTMNWLTINILSFVWAYAFPLPPVQPPSPEALAFLEDPLVPATTETTTSEQTAMEKCLTKPVSCCFKDVSLQEACEWFEYLMSVKIDIDEDAMRQARGDEGRHVSLETENMPFEEVLEKMLTPVGLAFEVTEKGIRIKTEAASAPVPATPADEDVPYSEEEAGSRESVPYFKEDPKLTEEERRQTEKAQIKAELYGTDKQASEEKAPEKSKEEIFLESISEQSPYIADVAESIKDRLAKPISVNIQKLPLEIVCRDLQNLSGINIVLDKVALSEAGVGLEQPLSLTVEDISMKSVLNLLLKQANLTYQIKDDAILITTEAVVRGPVTRVTYSVARYLEKTDSNKHCEKKLIDLITNTIAPESWESTGGPGKIQYFPNEQTLVISQQTQDVHERITELFAALDRLRDNSAIPEPCTVEQLDQEPKSEISLINTPFPPSLRGLVVGIPLPQRQVSVVFTVADLIVPADDVTPVVCKMLNKSFERTAKDPRTLEGDLIELITTKIDPDSWESSGGLGKLQFFPLGMSLVVVNAKEVQKKVADLLANLRELQDKQDKEYVLEMKLVEAREDGEPEESPLPKITMMQGRWFTLFQGKTVTLKDGSIQDLLAGMPEKTEVVLLQGSRRQTKKPELTEDDVPVGLVIRGKVTTLEAGRVRLDLILQQSELDSASRDDIVVVGSSVRSAQRIRSGEAFNHVLKESEDGEPMVWLEVRVQAVQGEAANKMATPPMFRGIEGPMPRP